MVMLFCLLAVKREVCMLSYKASAPGSLMLLGEYAVMHDYPALVCAIDKRITVTLVPSDDEVIEIDSALGSHHTTYRNS